MSTHAQRIALRKGLSPVNAAHMEAFDTSKSRYNTVQHRSRHFMTPSPLLFNTISLID
jgi:hypothetical protein